MSAGNSSLDMRGHHRLQLEVVWQDEHIVELMAAYATADWSGRASGYTGHDALPGFAAHLASFAKSLRGEACLEAGRDDGTGYIKLRIYPKDATGHLACYLQLATATATNDRPEEIRRVAIELRTEPAALDVFLHQVEALANTKQGAAVLTID